MTDLESTQFGAYRAAITPSGTIWGVSTRRHVLTVQEPGMEVTMYTDGLLYGRSNGGEAMHTPTRAHPFYLSKIDLAHRARKVLDGIGWHAGPEVTFPLLPGLDSYGKCRREILYLFFSDRPNGFPAKRVGNTSMIGLDSLTGEVVELQRFIGYRYAPPQLKISTHQAVKIARESILASGDIEVNGPAYQLLGTDEVLSPRAAALCRTMTLPLAYRVVGENGFVVVSADTGEVLSVREETRCDSSSSRKIPSEPFPPIVFGIGIGLFALLAFAFLREMKRLRRP